MNIRSRLFQFKNFFADFFYVLDFYLLESLQYNAFLLYYAAGTLLSEFTVWTIRQLCITKCGLLACNVIDKRNIILFAKTYSVHAVRRLRRIRNFENGFRFQPRD